MSPPPATSQIDFFFSFNHPKTILFLELCCVTGDNGISMNLYRWRREINGSSPSWRKKKNYRATDEVNSRFHLRGPRPLLASPGGLGTGKPTPIHSINSRDPATAASHSPRSPPSQGQPAAQDPRPHPGTRTAAHGAPRTPRGPLGEPSPPPSRGSRKPGLRRG